MFVNGIWRCATVLASLVLVLSSWGAQGAENSVKSADARLREVADTYLAAHLRTYPLVSYGRNIPQSRHDLFTTNAPASLRAFEALQDAALMNLGALDPKQLTQPARLFLASFAEALQAARQTRVCRSELWSVSHIFGMHARLQNLTNQQPVETAEQRRQALLRWSAAADYFDQEIVNLKKGLAQGYSVPKSVVNRVIAQLASLNAYETASHPYTALATRAKDAAFTGNFVHLLDTSLMPAMRRYEDFLRTHYVENARQSRAITALPRGRECYRALYRRYTTLERSGEEIHNIGLAAVARYETEVSALGKQLYGTSGFAETVAAANNSVQGSFSSADDYENYLRDVVARAAEKSKASVYRFTSIPMVVEPLAAFRQGKGVPAHYIAGTAKRPGRFVFDPASFAKVNRATAEILAVHEGYPGHHLPISLTQAGGGFHPLANLLTYSGYSEGWARYAETLAEELGIYQTDAAKVMRRSWPARGMVLDTGLHVLGWSKEDLVAFLDASGHKDFTRDPEAMLDRIAVLPAQLTAYDSGGLELFALREQLQAAMGASYDPRMFHAIVLDGGPVPLPLLRQMVENTIAELR